MTTYHYRLSYRSSPQTHSWIKPLLLFKFSQTICIWREKTAYEQGFLNLSLSFADLIIYYLKQPGVEACTVKHLNVNLTHFVMVYCIVWMPSWLHVNTKWIIGLYVYHRHSLLLVTLQTNRLQKPSYSSLIRLL